MRSTKPASRAASARICSAGGQTDPNAAKCLFNLTNCDTSLLFSPRMQWIKTSIGRLRVIGCWEGVSFLVLLGIAMPLKYLAGHPEAVRVVGMAHGVLFLLYIWAAIQAALAHEWNWKRTGLVLLASLLPAGPFVVDARLLCKDSSQ